MEVHIFISVTGTRVHTRFCTRRINKNCKNQGLMLNSAVESYVFQISVKRVRAPCVVLLQARNRTGLENTTWLWVCNSGLERLPLWVCLPSTTLLEAAQGGHIPDRWRCSAPTASCSDSPPGSCTSSSPHPSHSTGPGHQCRH